jgi:UDP-glucuronate decarboxylase
VDIRIARIFNTYGPRMRFQDGRVVSNFVGQALEQRPLTIYGDGEQTRSFCYVSDLVDGLERLFRSSQAEPVNLGNPTEFTVRELAELVSRLIGGSAGVVSAPLPVDDPRQRRPDITTARSVLGWEPKVPLEEGLQLTIQDFRSRLGAVA